MNPQNLAKELTHNLTEYVRNAMPVEAATKPDNGESPFTKKLDDFFEKNKLVQSPYVELIEAFQKGRTLSELVEAGSLHKTTAEIFAKYFGGKPEDIHLHKHQDDAVKIFAKYFGGKPEDIHLHQHQVDAVATKKTNLIVTTGTGSGKTECFLLPIIDQLVREAAENGGNPKKGVHAILLYPMNALVNDQIRRLRKLLAGTQITFGRYTGELNLTDDDNTLKKTEGEIKKIVEEILKKGVCKNDAGLGVDENAPISNEFTKRSQWQDDKKAHILVTNYMMLENLMLDPSKDNFFGANCQFIVLDEAHTYTGALGTDIAWLVRRLTKRLNNNQIKYIATSATMGANDSETRAFAAQLFPANSDSFQICSEKRQSFEPVKGARKDDLTQEEITAIQNKTIDDANIKDFFKSTNLLEVTSLFLNESEFTAKYSSRVENLLERVKNNKAIGLKDAVALLKLFQSTVQLKMIEHDLAGDFLADQKNLLKPFFEFLRFWTVEKGDRDGKDIPNDEAFSTKRRDVRNVWRDVLHDYGSQKKSPFEDDTVNGNRNKLGNKLDILMQWQDGNVTSVDALEIMMEQCIEIFNEISIDYQINCYPVHLSENYRTGMGKLQQWFTDHEKGLKQVESTLKEYWKVLLNYQGNENNPSIPEMFSWYLGGTQLIQDLIKILKKNNENTQYEKIAQGLEIKEESLDVILSLCNMARRPGNSKNPLVDVRIHQFLRGLEPIGLELFKNENDQVDFNLHRTSDVVANNRRIMTLGVCRKCGQPFLMGYSDQKEGFGQIYRYHDETNKFLHAYVWSVGNGYTREGNEPGIQCYYNPATGNIYAPHIQDTANFIPLYFSVNPENNDTPEFLNKCPCCQSSNPQNARQQFGVITPFAAKSSINAQLQLVALDTLAKNMEPSPDPVIRAFPGEGRKLLAFSDSRQGAAKVAVRYQEYWAKTSINKLICDVAGMSDEDMRMFLQDELSEEAIPAHLRRAMSLEMIRTTLQNVSVEDLPSYQAKLIKKLFQKYHLESLLELSANDTELSQDEVAIFRLLNPLRIGGRNSILRTQKVQVSSKNLEDYLRNNLNLTLMANTNFMLDHEQTCTLLRRIYRYLFEEVRFAQNLWNNCSLNKYKKCVRGGNNQEDEIKFCSQASNAKLNKIVREFYNEKEQPQQLMPAQAKEVLEKIWPILIGDDNDDPRVLDGNENGPYSLMFDPGNLNVIVIPGSNANQESQLDEKIIPVRIEEHTAQISKKRGAAYQKAFAEGRINIISCSTTFEMGIDLGDLSCLYMTNLPPSVSNYRQRAGRAGRRAGSTAYVVTMLGTQRYTDSYCFDHAEEMIFSKVPAPDIYLDNPVFQARHLRAEALHDFLKWVTSKNRNIVQKLNDPDNTITMNWRQVSHFFHGAVSSWRKPGDRPDAMRIQSFARGYYRISTQFDPMYMKLTEWAKLNPACPSLPGLETITWNPIKDLVWQITGDDTYTPLENGNAEQYRLLGGPRKMVDGGFTESLLAKMQAEYRVKVKGRNGVGEYVEPTDDLDRNITKQAHSYLQTEKLVDCFCHNKILPKYGFPIDVIELFPAEDDYFSEQANDLKRPAHLGIFEYAPGMHVYADKRIFPAEKPLKYVNGDYQVISSCDAQWYECENPYCRQISHNGGRCPVCGRQMEEPFMVVKPTAFQAKKARAYGEQDFEIPKGARNLTTFDSFPNAQQKEVPGTRIKTLFSREGEVVYLNRGPEREGFSWQYGEEETQNVTKCSFYQTIITDVVFWKLPTFDFWEEGAKRKRLIQAIKSAAAALRLAIVTKLEIRDSEINVFMHAPESNKFGFVICDETPGGSGILAELTLTSDETINERRSQLIKSIITEAIRICSDCECYRCDNAELVPKPVNEWLNDPSAGRPAASCYKCLRSYSNQAEHEYLDRYDACKILNELLINETQQQPADEWPKIVHGICFEQYQGDDLQTGQTYLLSNGRVASFLSGRFTANDVIGKKKD